MTQDRQNRVEIKPDSINSDSSIHSFQLLYRFVWDELDEVCWRMRIPLRKPFFWLILASRSAFLFLMIILLFFWRRFFDLSLWLIGIMPLRVELSGLSIAVMGTTLACVIFILAPFLMLIPVAFFPHRVQTRTWQRLLIPIQVYTIAPLWLLLIDALLELRTGDNFALQTIFISWTVLVAILIFVSVVVLLIAAFTVLVLPTTFWLLLTTMAQPGRPIDNTKLVDSYVPSQDELTDNIVNKIYYLNGLSEWSTSKIGKIDEIAQHHREGIELQTQATSFLLAAPALLGLLSLLYPQGLTQTLYWIMSISLRWLWQEETGISESTVRVLAVLFLLGLIIMAIWYAIHTYKLLRALEIIHVWCVEATDTAESIPIQQPTHVMLPHSRSDSVRLSWLPWMLSAMIVSMLMWQHRKRK